MQETKTDTIAETLIDSDFLHDCIAESCERMFKRYKAVQDRLDQPVMATGCFVNSILARGIHAACQRVGVKSPVIRFGSDFPDAAFCPIIDALYTEHRQRNFRRDLKQPVPAFEVGLKFYKNVLMLDGLSELCKTLLPVEQQLGIV